MSKNSKGFLTILLAFIGYMLVGLLKSYSNELLNFSTFINDTLVPSLFFIVFFAVKSRLLCKMLYNVFTISTYQN
ncbi:hypothetical protein [Enterococcus faecium]|uniref:hypothetical protein n=1 Tax=Enterococcus faecium TaxID=1352 RepID=UPI001020955E|nr:hypothetical protein [Enterococcus faecium]RYJ84154.1 hypothetical protein EWH82_07250 [Enterococcus faecium]RYJ96114.1 hypothetical protein EWI06_07545 [Enterococcus faecium]RYK03345.1 hypothetical protein EWH81_07835 [Enterococcus faecium]RYK09936.1 hypothetical protein EWH71_05315 [Enterococcus faecium]RYK12246.1 hypothetical protein EWH90_07605 [Enterococcus faecium]